MTTNTPLSPHCTPLQDSGANYDWVAAHPFRVLLRQLCAETGMTWFEVAFAAHIPYRTARSLLHGRANRPARRIRRCDARALLNVDAPRLRERAQRFVPTTTAHATLAGIWTGTPSLAELSYTLGVSQHTVTGLVEGWLEHCPAVVTWRVEALAEEQHSEQFSRRFVPAASC